MNYCLTVLYRNNLPIQNINSQIKTFKNSKRNTIYKKNTKVIHTYSFISHPNLKLERNITNK